MDYSSLQRNEFIQKNIKKNTSIFNISGALGSLGTGLVPLGTMLTYYIANYTDSNIFVGLMNFMAPLFTNMPQIFLARIMKKLRYNKEILVINGIITKAVWIILGFITLSVHNNIANLIIFLVIFSIVNFGQSVHQLTWNDTIAKVVPLDVRGRFVGMRSFIAGVCEFLASLLMGFLLGSFAFPNNYAIVFLFSGVLSVLSSVIFIFLKEPPSENAENGIPLMEYLKQLKDILKYDKTFDAFLIYDHFAILSRTISVFLIVYAKARLNLTPSDMVMVTVVLTISQTTFYLIWGYIDDRFGYKPSMALSAFGFMSANLVAFLFLKNVIILGILYIFIGASQSARNLGRINLVIHLAQGNDVRTYIALNNMILTVPFSVFPLLCGVLIDNFGFTPFFILNIISGIIAVYIMLFMVNEKRFSEVSQSVNKKIG